MISKQVREKVAFLREFYPKVEQENYKDFLRDINRIIKSIGIQKYSKHQKQAEIIIQELNDLKKKVVKKFKPEVKKQKFAIKTFESAFENNVVNVRVLNYHYKLLKEFFQGIKTKVIRSIRNHIAKLISVKIYSMFTGIFGTPKYEEITMYLCTYTQSLQKSADLNQWYDQKVMKKLTNSISEFQEGGSSNLKLKEIISLKFYIHRYEILKGIGTYVPTPKFIEAKNAVINIKNQ